MIRLTPLDFALLIAAAIVALTICARQSVTPQHVRYVKLIQTIGLIALPFTMN